MAQSIARKHTLKFQITASLAALFLLLTGASVYTLNSVNARKHDYAVLNLAGQLRVITAAIINQSNNYRHNAPRDYPAYYRDLNLYHKDLALQISAYDDIIQSFINRRLDPEVTGFSDAITCTWDRHSISQLQYTATTWEQFKTGLNQALGAELEEPRLEAAADYVVQSADMLKTIVNDLNDAFRLMMQAKLNDVTHDVQSILILSILLAAGLLFLLYRQVIRPVENTVKGIQRISAGEIGHQITTIPNNELGILNQAVNDLSSTLNAIFNLTSHVNSANNLDETLKTVFDEFKDISPINLVGLFRVDAARTQIILDRVYCDHKIQLSEQQVFGYVGSIMADCIDTGRVTLLDNITYAQHEHPESTLLSTMKQDGFHSALLLPLTTRFEDNTVIIFASSDINAFAEEHASLLRFIANQLTHSFEKTVVMENLVISAIEGLAKLAESRDPETGDHLLRMSIYSSLIAEELGRGSPYQHQIDNAYVRDILKFAPMHDIGKVGIEDRILLKPGQLTDEERREMQQHPTIGGNVLRRCEAQMNAVGHSIFTMGIDIADGHHEKFDGSGYPNGLNGEQIPLSARIVAVADVFDALTSKRPYKSAWPVEQALTFIGEQAGQHFDPVVVTALNEALPKIQAIYDQHKHI